jgi:hypothetical protein
MTDFSVEDLYGFMGENGSTVSAEEVFDQIDIEFDEELISPDKPFIDNVQTIGDGNCIVCSAPTFRPPGLTKAGHKKRVPKYCNDHAGNISIPGKASQLRGVDSELQNVQEALADDIRLLGILAGPMLPTTGMFMVQQANPFTIAIIKLAKNNKAILRVLHRAAQVAPVYQVAQTVAGAAYSVQVDINNVDPHSTIAKRLGVETAYNAVNPDQVPSDFRFAEPPRY